MIRGRTKLYGHLAFATLLVAALPLWSCAESAQQGKKGKKSGGEVEGGDPADGEGGSGESEGGSDDDGKTLEQVLADCGGKDAAEAGPDDVIYQKSLRSIPIVKSILVVKVTIDSQLDIEVTGAKTVQYSKVTVSKIEAPIGAKLVKGLAEKQAAASSGATTLTNVPISEYGSLSEHEAYDGVICTIVPAAKIDNRRGGRKTIAEFDPPVPSSISPRAIGERYKEELGASRVFDGIKAKVIETDSPDLNTGDVLTGRVKVEKVAAETQVDDGKGGKKTIKADLAYKVTYDFGSPKATFALGFAPSVTYYIDHEKHDLKANVVDTSAVEGAVAVFEHP